MVDGISVHHIHADLVLTYGAAVVFDFTVLALKENAFLLRCSCF